MFSNTTGYENTADGVGALFSNTTGFDNVATGLQALNNSTTGFFNTATGNFSLFSLTIGTQNTATGFGALVSNSSGNNNTAEGMSALFNSIGSNNIALGFEAGSDLVVGDNNIDIGNRGRSTESNTIRIGTKTTHTATFIAGIAEMPVSGSQVVVNSNGKLGITSSSARFKDAIKPMGDASNALFQLKPITFRYKDEIDPYGTPQFGLVAEEVEKIDPNLVARDSEGRVNTVRYDQVNAMLLNEFLKEHRKVEQLQKQVEALTAGLQKVSAQLEASKPAPQVVNNP
jgi:trimeric autotransporter adhesin